MQPEITTNDIIQKVRTQYTKTIEKFDPIEKSCLLLLECCINYIACELEGEESYIKLVSYEEPNNVELMHEEVQDSDDVKVISSSAQEEIESKSNTLPLMINSNLKDCEVHLKRCDSLVSLCIPQIKDCEVVLKRLDFPDNLTPNQMLEELKRDRQCVSYFVL